MKALELVNKVISEVNVLRLKYSERVANIISKYNFSIRELLMNDLILTTEQLEVVLKENIHEELSSNPNLTSEMIIKYWGKWNIGILSFNTCLTREIITKYWKVNCNEITWNLRYLFTNPKLTEEVLEENIHKFNYSDWNILSLYYRVSLKLVDKYKDYISFKLLSTNTHLTREIIDKYYDLFDMKELVKNPCFTLDMLNQIDLKEYRYEIYMNPNMDLELFDKIYKVGILNKIEIRNIHPDIIDKYKEEIEISKYILNENLNRTTVEYICSKIKKYDNISALLSCHKSLTCDLMIKYSHILCVSRYVNNPNLTSEMIVMFFNHFSKIGLVKQYKRLVYENEHRKKYLRAMIQLEFCPYYRDNDKEYKHHYYQGYGYLMSLEDTMLNHE